MNAENSVGPQATSTSSRPRARRNSRLALWILVVLVFGGAVWAVMSESQTAQEIQEAVGWKHDQSILEESFTVGPRNFQYFKFSLPEGSVNISVIGQFNVTGSSGNQKDKEVSIEAYVLTESAFTVWQHGYATSSLYESGRVPEGTIDAQLPAGAGVYYLIFNNRYTPKSSKNLHATALLRYKSWLPEPLRIVKDRFLNWVSW